MGSIFLTLFSGISNHAWYGPFFKKDMKKIIINITVLLCCGIMVHAQSTADSAVIDHELLAPFRNWTTTELVKGGRIDAIRQLEGSVILCATRGLNRGKLFISNDHGNTWRFLAQPTDAEITCIAETGRRNEFYILTGTAEVFGTQDGGKSWQRLIRLTEQQNSQRYTSAYAIMHTGNGTLLATDTDEKGGHIYRSADKGRSWNDMGAVAKKALYRLEKTGNGIVVNGWDGAIYKSTDDGITWNRKQQLADTPLFATEYAGMGRLLQADQAGDLYYSTNLGDTWKRTGNLTDAADDFVNAGYGAVYYSTYTGKREVYVSIDFGRSWRSIGKVPTGVEGDWLDHGIRTETADSIFIVAGTAKGFIIRNAISKQWLSATIDRFNRKDLSVGAKVLPLSALMTGYLTDPLALNEPEDILYHEGFAYIPCRDGNNVAIIDCSDPRKPLLAASLRDESISDAFSVAIKDHYLYVLSMTNHCVSVFNIKDPAHPRKTAAISVGGNGSYLSTYDSDYTRLRKICIEGNYAYVTHSSESKVYILDISRPERPLIVSSFHTGDGAFAALARNNVLYLAGYGPGSSVIAVDVSDKAKPVIKNRVLDTTLLKGTCALALSGNKLYITAYNANTFWTMDVAAPFALQTDSYIKHPGMKGPGRVAIKGRMAYVLNSTNHSVAAIDVSDPRKPEVKFYLQDPLLRTVYGIAVDGDYLYLAGRQASSFVVVDLRKVPAALAAE